MLMYQACRRAFARFGGKGLEMRVCLVVLKPWYSVYFRRGRMAAQLDTGSIEETRPALSKAVSNITPHSPAMVVLGVACRRDGVLKAFLAG